MEKEKNCQKMNIINGKLKEAKSGLENLNDFIKRWQEKIKEIKKMVLNEKQAYHIAEAFINEASLKFFYQDSIKNKSLILHQLGQDLFLALFQANNNYKKQFPSFWNFLSKLKLPDLSLIKVGKNA